MNERQAGRQAMSVRAEVAGETRLEEVSSRRVGRMRFGPRAQERLVKCKTLGSKNYTKNAKNAKTLRSLNLSNKQLD